MTETQDFQLQMMHLLKASCFHSNQYFYVPQENIKVLNEQCVCQTLVI